MIIKLFSYFSSYLLKYGFTLKQYKSVYSNNNCYLYYAGTYVKAEGISYSGNQFVYADKVAINLGKFISNEGNVTITDTSVSSFSSFKVIYDTNNNEWKKATTIKVA